MDRNTLFSQLAAAARDLSASVIEGLTSRPALGPDDIHEFRVTTKRLRAYWLLAAPLIGRDRARAYMNDLRDAARIFAGHRDDFVRDTLLQELTTVRRQKVADAASLICHELFGEEVVQPAPPLPAEVDVCVSTLEHDTYRWNRREQELSSPDDGALIRDGLAKTYVKAGRRGRVALTLDTPQGYHRWRRWVKYSYYQHSWLYETLPELGCSRGKLLKRLGSTLGRAHDVHQLREDLDRRSIKTGSPKAFRSVRKFVLAEEARLAKRARRLGRKALWEDPQIVSHRILKEARRVSVSRIPEPSLKFESLAHHEGNGASRAADAPDPR